MAHTNIDEQTRFKATELVSESDDFNKIGFEINSTKSVIFSIIEEKNTKGTQRVK